LHAWRGYKEHAWGQDEVKPVDGGINNWMGLGLTITDSLDTLWIMDLKDEFQDARNWIENSLNFEVV
jgi:mannosyl-oligosaccharide alpha-1,2-mannosidase